MDDAPDAPVVLGLDFGGTKTALAVVSPDGTRLGSAVHETRPDLGADASLDRAIAAGRELLGRAAPGRRLGAVGVATIGIPGEYGVTLAPNIPGWDGLALGRELRGAFPGASIRLATDVKAAARVEAESGALVGCDPAIYLNLGTGLAVASSRTAPSSTDATALPARSATTCGGSPTWASRRTAGYRSKTW